MSVPDDRAMHTTKTKKKRGRERENYSVVSNLFFGSGPLFLCFADFCPGTVFGLIYYQSYSWSFTPPPPFGSVNRKFWKKGGKIRGGGVKEGVRGGGGGGG